MHISEIGILGTGLWDGDVVTNEHFGPDFAKAAAVKDPYRGRRSDDGTIRIAGMTFTPERYKRTLAALEQCLGDPYRGTRRRRYFPPNLKVSDAETEAARNAMADAGVTPAQIDAVLVQSFLPDVIQPKNAALIAHNLGMRHAPAWEVDSICNSSLTHFAVRALLITAGPIDDYYQNHGPGLHHLALRVENVDTVLDKLRRRGFGTRGSTVETAPGLREVFLDPTTAGGCSSKSSNAENCLPIVTSSIRRASSVS